MNEIFEKMEQLKIIPVVKIENASDATFLADALIAGGLPVAEITFRTAAAPDAIRSIARRNDIMVGAGTVLSIDMVKKAVDAGAAFIVSPGFNPKVVEYCIASDIPVTPGVCTPTEITTALEYGLEVLKFFPAEAMGGLKTLKAVSAPYSMVRFIPTGGINDKNVSEYLAFDKTFCCGGSWMVQSNLISGNDFNRITQLTKEAVQTAGVR